MDYDSEVQRLLSIESKKACVMECMRLLSEAPAAEWYGRDLCKLSFCTRHHFTNADMPILRMVDSTPGKASMDDVCDRRGNQRYYRDKVKLGSSYYVVSNGIRRGPQKWGSDNLKFLVQWVVYEVRK